MTPNELRTVLIAAIAARENILITGAPGVGKSDIVSAACAASGADLILSHPVVEDPTDAKGLPWLSDGRADFLPFGQLRKAMTATVRTVWFLDDFGQATQAVQAAYMQLLLAREVNGHRISDHVTFIAATNRRTDRAGVSGILEPVKSRFASIVELSPTIDDWCNWAIDHDVPPELIAFLRFSPDKLSAFTATTDLTNSPTPRTWAAAGRLLSWNLAPSVRHELLAGAIGEGAAVELLAFLRLYAELPNIDQILIDPTSAQLPTTPAAAYAVCSALAHRTTAANFERVAQYAQRLIDAARAEFAVLLVRDALRRQPDIAQTSAFVRLVTTAELSNIFSGDRTAATTR
jgi:hypothetical protein